MTSKPDERHDRPARGDRRAEAEASPFDDGSDTTEVLPPTAAVEESPHERELRELRTERDAHHERWLLAVADLDNYRKRTQKEIETERRYAALPLVRDLVGVLDNFQRALESARTAADKSPLVEGIQLVARQFDDALARHGVTPIEAVGKPFDPNLHQALAQLPAPDKPPMTVLAEYQKGYQMHDRVVRPSTVAVSTASDAATS